MFKSSLLGFRAHRSTQKTIRATRQSTALQPAIQPVIEALENRVLFTAYTLNSLSSSSLSWGTSSIWSPSTGYPSSPADSSNLSVAITTNLGISLPSGGTTVNSINLGDSALSGGVGYTEAITGSNTLTFDNGSSAASLTLASGAVAGATIAAPISLNSNLTITNNSSQTLTISGNIALNGHTITVTGPGNVVISGAAASGSPATLVMQGTGTLTLNGSVDNSYLALNAQAGTTILAKTNSAGAHAVASISGIATGATVQLAGTGGDQIFNGVPGYAGGVVMGGETLDLAGTSEAFDTLTGTGTVTNSSSAASTLSIGSNNGSGTFSGTIQGGNGLLTLEKIGSGTLTLAGTGDNSYLLLDAEAGTTILAKTNSGSAHATAAISNIASGATVKLAGSGSDQIFNGVPGYPGGVHMGGGTLDLAGNVEAFDTLTGSGTVTNSSSAASALLLGSDNGSGTFSGTIQGSSGSALTLVTIGSGTVTLGGTGDDIYLLLDAEAGTTVLAKTNSGGAHAVAAISNIASGATVTLAGSGGDQERITGRVQLF